jgi:type 1 glutamine amidotransferase
MSRRTWIVALVSVVVVVVLALTLSFLLFTRRQSAAQPVSAQHTSYSQKQKDVTTNAIKLLVFSKTAGFRHASIKDGIIALKKLGVENKVAIDFTENAAMFTDANLKQYNVVVFLMATGDLLNNDQQAAFERYIRAGGGYAGVHSASDAEYKWAWYGKLVGAFFHDHPHIQQATIHVLDHNHPSTADLPDQWVRTDEWYNFATNPSNSVHVLMTVDEKTYTGGKMGTNHPIAWYHQYDGGRSWYTAIGHTSESYYDHLFLAHLWGGIMYAAGAH